MMPTKLSTVIAELQGFLEREGDKDVVVDCEACKHLDRESGPRWVWNHDGVVKTAHQKAASESDNAQD